MNHSFKKCDSRQRSFILCYGKIIAAAPKFHFLQCYNHFDTVVTYELLLHSATRDRVYIRLNIMVINLLHQW